MNHEAKVARIALGVMIGFIVLVFVPRRAGMDMMNGGFAIAFVSVFLAISACVTWMVFRRRAGILGRFLEGRDVLAKWEVPSELWVKHIAADLEEEKRDKKTLFMIVVFWVVIIGGGFILFTGEDGLFVAGMLGILLLILVPFAFWLPRLRAARMLKNPTAVVIGREGAYVGGELHDWRLAGGFFGHAEMDATKDPKQLRIDYSYISGRGVPVPCEVRIPIPPDKVDEARRVVEELKKKGK